MTLKELHRPFVSCVLLLAVCACSPEGPTPEPDNIQAVKTQAREAPRNQAGETNLSSRAESAPKQAAAGARRCGWLHNPTPANWWLVDRDGQWVLGSQGGHQAPGLHEMPDMSAGEWVEVNGHYGYGCACMNVVADPATRRVSRVSDATPKPLTQCRGDRRLPHPGEG